ncbi:MAG TPA: cobalamin-binding protein [Gemmatimonadales bacterium]|jgi:iron complex transport system substrate-binding protein
MKIVSLIASATEIVCALGLEDQLVARSHECDFPESVKRLPQASRPSFVTAGSSKAIDVAVKDRLRQALSIYEVDAALLRELQPDLILTQTQCEVCAVTPADVERAICETTGHAARIVALEPNSLGDVWDDIRRVAEAAGIPERGATLVERLRRRVLEIGVRAARLEKPGVACIEWIDPLMTAGNWMPELIEMAGGAPLFGEAGKHSPWLEWEQLVAKDPEVLLVSPCGFAIPRTLEELPALESRPGWRDLRAVREGRVFVADGNAYFHRPGPRLVESLEILAEVLHPSRFNFGHRGTGWIIGGAVTYPAG